MRMPGEDLRFVGDYSSAAIGPISNAVFFLGPSGDQQGVVEDKDAKVWGG
jgi:hypothetical protein